MKAMVFTPKSGGEPWTASLDDTADYEGSGYDVVLFLDKVAKTADSGWMLELAIEADGTIAGQITAHPGYDALAIFTCMQDRLIITDNSNGLNYIISDAPEPEAPVPTAIEGTPTGHEAVNAEMMRRIKVVVDGARAIDDRLNDRDNDGRDSEAPDGDSYNELMGELGPLLELFPRED